jgi:1-carboxybiuret hydrolase subunit AtzG-like
MARTRKSRPQAKTARASGARKPPAGRKAAAKPKSRKPPPPDALDSFVEAAARLLALPVESQWLAAIKANLEVNLRLAAFVAEFSLPDETEPAPIFTA